ncbi:hypothetical protein SE959_21110 [Escherichia coli]|nr:hypothetical protein [Escherichia coli]
MPTTGAHRWKHKLSQQHPAIRPDAVLYYAVERKVVSKGYVHGRWRLPETSAVACLNASVTLYCHSRFNSELSVFP